MAPRGARSTSLAPRSIAAPERPARLATARPVVIATCTSGTRDSPESAASAARSASSPLDRTAPNTAIIRPPIVRCATPRCSVTTVSNAAIARSTARAAPSGSPASTSAPSPFFFLGRSGALGTGDTRANSAVTTRCSPIADIPEGGGALGRSTSGVSWTVGVSSTAAAIVPCDTGTRASASTRSPADRNRCSGAFASARITSASSAGGTCGAIVERSGGSSSRIFASNTNGSLPVKGRRPASIS